MKYNEAKQVEAFRRLYPIVNSDRKNDFGSNSQSHVGAVLQQLLGQILSLLLRFYQVFISPQLGPSCRYEPSCSVYADQALRTYPTWKAIQLILARLSRCLPGRGFGCDPLPARGSNLKTRCSQ